MKLFLVAALAASASAFTVPEVKVPAVSPILNCNKIGILMFHALTLQLAKQIFTLSIELFM